MELAKQYISLVSLFFGLSNLQLNQNPSIRIEQEENFVSRILTKANRMMPKPLIRQKEREEKEKKTQGEEQQRNGVLISNRKF